MSQKSIHWICIQIYVHGIQNMISVNLRGEQWFKVVVPSPPCPTQLHEGWSQGFRGPVSGISLWWGKCPHMPPTPPPPPPSRSPLERTSLPNESLHAVRTFAAGAGRRSGRRGVSPRRRSPGRSLSQCATSPAAPQTTHREAGPAGWSCRHTETQQRQSSEEDREANGMHYLKGRWRAAPLHKLHDI